MVNFLAIYKPLVNYYTSYLPLVHRNGVAGGPGTPLLVFCFHCLIFLRIEDSLIEKGTGVVMVQLRPGSFLVFCFREFSFSLLGFLLIKQGTGVAVGDCPGSFFWTALININRQTKQTVTYREKRATAAVASPCRGSSFGFRFTGFFAYPLNLALIAGTKSSQTGTAVVVDRGGSTFYRPSYFYLLIGSNLKDWTTAADAPPCRGSSFGLGFTGFSTFFRTASLKEKQTDSRERTASAQGWCGSLHSVGLTRLQTLINKQTYSTTETRFRRGAAGVYCPGGFSYYLEFAGFLIISYILPSQEREEETPNGTVAVAVVLRRHGSFCLIIFTGFNLPVFDIGTKDGTAVDVSRRGSGFCFFRIGKSSNVGQRGAVEEVAQRLGSEAIATIFNAKYSSNFSGGAGVQPAPFFSLL